MIPDSVLEELVLTGCILGISYSIARLIILFLTAFGRFNP